jgi:hypothetical protein
VTVGAGLAIMPNPAVGFVLQGAGVRALIGTAPAQRLKVRGARADRGAIIARWTVAGGALATAIVLVDLLLAGVA